MTDRFSFTDVTIERSPIHDMRKVSNEILDVIISK